MNPVPDTDAPSGTGPRGPRAFDIALEHPQMDMIIGTVEAFVLAGILGVASLATAGVLHIG